MVHSRALKESRSHESDMERRGAGWVKNKTTTRLVKLNRVNTVAGDNKMFCWFRLGEDRTLWRRLDHTSLDINLTTITKSQKADRVSSTVFHCLSWLVLET
jgi:hypothetical protein